MVKQRHRPERGLLEHALAIQLSSVLEAAGSSE
jgi:hypothetical protein